VVNALRPALLVLSAKNEERLKAQAGQLVAAIGRRALGDEDLADVAYTLQVGREAMECRLGLIAASMAELVSKLGRYLADESGIEEFYLGETPILKNVPTYLCRKPDELTYVLANLGELVVKEVHGAGGYGMLIGPAATKAEIEDFRKALLANPSGYIAQPTLSLSTCPTYVDSGIAPRHIDLRPFVLSGKEVQMVPGGLTRVALKEGSLVVNSSQGGGTKDTWVLEA